jgi:hypothetical protein
MTALYIKARRIRTAGKHNERGFALLVVIFLVTLLLISTIVVAPNLLTEGRREKEKEMIWRGKQYTRGVKLYYRKMGRFPTSLDDLIKPKIGSLRFMRQAYKDPMSKDDGSWRLIYVGPGGQLIGSLKPTQQGVQIPGTSGIGTPAGALNGPGTAPPGATGQQGLGGLFGGPGASPGGSGFGVTGPGANPLAGGGAPVSADQGTPPSNPAAAPTTDASGNPTIIGGNIIGVGSKVDKSSIMIYDHATKYLLFEFIWDPSKDRFGGAQPGLGQQIGQPVGQQPGQNPGNPQNPTQNPLQPQQNPRQQ